MNFKLRGIKKEVISRIPASQQTIYENMSVVVVTVCVCV